MDGSWYCQGGSGHTVGAELWRDEKNGGYRIGLANTGYGQNQYSESAKVTHAEAARLVLRSEQFGGTCTRKAIDGHVEMAWSKGEQAKRVLRRLVLFENLNRFYSDRRVRDWVCRARRGEIERELRTLDVESKKERYSRFFELVGVPEAELRAGLSLAQFLSLVDQPSGDAALDKLYRAFGAQTDRALVTHLFAGNTSQGGAAWQALLDLGFVREHGAVKIGFVTHLFVHSDKAAFVQALQQQMGSAGAAPSVAQG